MGTCLHTLLVAKPEQDLVPARPSLFVFIVVLCRLGCNLGFIKFQPKVKRGLLHMSHLLASLMPPLLRHWCVSETIISLPLPLPHSPLLLSFVLASSRTQALTRIYSRQDPNTKIQSSTPSPTKQTCLPTSTVANAVA